MANLNIKLAVVVNLNLLRRRTGKVCAYSTGVMWSNLLVPVTVRQCSRIPRDLQLLQQHVRR